MLEYNPETGIFTRNGLRAGTAGVRGYRQIWYKGRQYYEHRLAWFIMTGEWPPDQMDHIDRDRSNNKWSNLRLADQAQNNWNSKNRSGYRGAYRNDKGTWMSAITVNGRSYFLGNYDTPEEAHQVYMEVAEEIHGDFFHAKSTLTPSLREDEPLSADGRKVESET